MDLIQLKGQCPICGGQLHAAVLGCSACRTQLHNQFQLSPFDCLSPGDLEFLITFLQARGNLSQVQEQRSLSYTNAKLRLEQLLQVLGLSQPVQEETELASAESEPDLTPASWGNAARAVYKKLRSCGGRTTVTSLRGKTYQVWLARNGVRFRCSALPLPEGFAFGVFDVIADFLCQAGGRAPKGSAQHDRLGEGACGRATLAYAIGTGYFGRVDGASVSDPGFALFAILDWAEVVYNRRGYVELRPEFCSQA